MEHYILSIGLMVVSCSIPLKDRTIPAGSLKFLDSSAHYLFYYYLIEIIIHSPLCLQSIHVFLNDTLTCLIIIEKI